MKNIPDVSRRHFLASSAALSGVSLLRVGAASLIAITQAACTARDGQAALAVLGRDEAADFKAIAARLVPTTETPGATEAGVIHFFDRAFATEMSNALSLARTGLAAFNAAVRDAYSGTRRFEDLSAREQDDFLATQETSDFFNLCREMTILGFLAMSKYGGNKDHVGWEVIGFEGNRGAWEYPFGFYDAAYEEDRSRGE